MYSIIVHTIYYVVVPAIMLVTFAAGIFIAVRSRTDHLRISTRAGLCAGLVAFAIYVVSSKFGLQSPAVQPIKLPGFYWIPLTAGLVVGFGLLLLVEQFDEISTGLVGLFVLFLIASSSIAAFSYFITSPLRAFAINFSLATLFGMLVNVVLFPGMQSKILDRDRKDSDSPRFGSAR